MIDLLIGFAFGAAPLGAAFFFALRDRAHERREWAKEKGQLLDRVMARDLTEYKALAERPVAPPIPQVVSDEDEAKYAEERGL